MPTTIHGADDSPHIAALELLKEMAENNWQINGILQPVVGGYLGAGSYSFTYEGIFEPIRRGIAMKFTSVSKKSTAYKEYEMYTYLNAINDATVAMFGIPNIYYFESWNVNYIVMGMTLFDSAFGEQLNAEGLTEIDILLLFREFVRILKYIHSCGIHHNDIKLDNVMFRRHQAFVIDFNLATKSYTRTRGGSMKYVSRRGHTTGERYATDDWESFLYSMCRLGGINLAWINNETLNAMPKQQQSRQIHAMKNNTDNTLNLIRNMGSNVLRGVFLQFAMQALQVEGQFPLYDRVYETIDEQIRGQLPSRDDTALVSWLTIDEKSKVLRHLVRNPLPNISTDITDPRQFDRSTYPPVNFEYFQELYHPDDASASESRD